MSAPSPQLSIAICTYNRSELLRLTVESLLAASRGRPAVELLIVDNHSTDATAATVADLQAAHPDDRILYVFEAAQGLSHARNRAFREAAADWVFYLDDDALSDPGLVDRLLELVADGTYPVVGGRYLPWYHFGRPAWFRDRYGSYTLNYRELTPIQWPDFATGGVMLWRKDLLEELGGFDPAIGMSGGTIAYGEETALQHRARERGYTIAYDPALLIHHVVMPYKLQVGWYFTAAFALGRDLVREGRIGVGVGPAIGQLCLGLAVATKDLLLYTPRLLVGDYYLENWLIDVWRKLAKRVGAAYTALLHDR